LYEEALEWLGKAANQGHAGAQFRLGQHKHSEIGTFADSHADRALAWYRAAAEQGHAEACMALCKLYWDFYYDQENAAHWYRRGRELGHPHDQDKLGFTVFGINIETELELEHLIQTAKLGKLREQRYLGLHYASVSPPDFIKAYAWLAQGFSHALGNSIPPYKYGEDRTIRTLRLLHLILDHDELEQAKRLISEIKVQHPPEPRPQPEKGTKRFLGLFGGNKEFDAAVNTLMAIVTFHGLSDEDRERVETEAKRAMPDLLGIKEPDQIGAELKNAVSNPEMIDTMHIQKTPIPRLSNLQEDARHGVYVVTLRNLGIKPAIPGERWRRVRNALGMFMNLDLDAKRDAEIFLEEKYGIDLNAFYEADASARFHNRD
jgi:hypothetical protein